MIITQSNVLDTIAASCASFRPAVEAFQTEYQDMPNHILPIYMLMGDLVLECSKQLREGPDNEIKKLFELVELWINDGDKYVRELAIVGFIEDMQNSNLHVDTRPEDFERFLGPASAIFWNKVNRFWSHREPITNT